MATRTKGRGKEMTREDRAAIRSALPVVFFFPPEAKGLLTKRQIAKLLGVSDSKFRLLRANGEYPEPSTHIGKLPRWTVEAHNGWLAKKCGKES